MRTQKIIQKYFTFPSVEAAKEEAGSSLPFPGFGYAGGFGLTRVQLREAIQFEEWNNAQHYYYLLIEEAIEEYFTEMEWGNPEEMEDEKFVCYCEQAATMLANAVDNLGYPK